MPFDAYSAPSSRRPGTGAAGTPPAGPLGSPWAAGGAAAPAPWTPSLAARLRRAGVDRGRGRTGEASTQDDRDGGGAHDH